METVAGWGAALPPWTCRRNGQPFDLSLYTVSLVMHDDTGAEVTIDAGQFVKLNQTTSRGKVQLTPDADGSTFDPATFTVTRNQKIFTVHVKAVDSNSRPVYFPGTGAAEILVHKR